jgi:hypothetical protein
MIIDDLHSLLAGASAVTAITPRVFRAQIPQQSRVPAVVIQRINSERGETFSEVMSQVDTTVQIDCYGGTMLEATQLADAVKSVLNGHSGSADGGYIHHARIDTELDFIEPSTKLRRVTQRYTVYHNED